MSSTAFDLSNRVFKLIMLFVIALCLFWGFRIYEIWTSVSGNYVREISVEGTGTAYVVPDTAVIDLGVNTTGATSEAVIAENTTKMNAVLEAVKALGVDPAKIQTTNYSLSPDYVWDDNGNESIDGYTLTQNVEVRLQDFNLIGTVMTAATTAGANMVSGVSFVIDDPETAKVAAREEAIVIAKEKAQQIADASGLSLSDIVNYYEYSNDPYSSGKGGYSEYAMMDSTMAAPTIEPGQQEVSLTVNLTYQIR